MKKEVKIGLFTLAMIVGAWAGIRFLSGVDLFNRNSDLYAHYSDVGGIQSASPVFVYGVKVGSVSEIALDPSKGADVVLTLTVSGKYQIPSDSKAELFSNGIMGGKAINIIPGESTKFLESGDRIESCQKVGLMDSAESELMELKTMVDGVTKELQLTLTTLNGIMTNNAEQISGVVANMESLTANLNGMVDEENGDLARMVDGFADLSQSLGDNAKNIDSIMLNVNTITGDLAKADLGETVKSSLESISTLTDKLSSDNGTLGKIMNDDQLYDNMLSITTNLDSLFVDFKERPDRYVNVSVFGKDYDKKYAKAEKKRAKAEKKR